VRSASRSRADGSGYCDVPWQRVRNWGAGRIWAVLGTISPVKPFSAFRSATECPNCDLSSSEKITDFAGLVDEHGGTVLEDSL
jgi:hypothetical protein